MFEAIQVTIDGVVAIIEFDHGKANEVGTAVLRDLERLPRWFIDNGIVGAITWSQRRSSRGTPLFVAGANIHERVGWSDDQIKQHVRWQRSVLGALRIAPVFHVAVVGGVALGWGTEYLLCCDYRIGCSEAVFGLPETGLGIVPGAGGSSELWAQIGVAQTLRLGMTGERIDSNEAARIGLIQETAADLDAGMARARALMKQVTTRSPTALAAFKRAVVTSVGTAREERVENEARAYELCVDAGEAAIGRSNFSQIRNGETPPWGQRMQER